MTIQWQILRMGGALLAIFGIIGVLISAGTLLNAQSVSMVIVVIIMGAISIGLAYAGIQIERTMAHRIHQEGLDRVWSAAEMRSER
jgi:hypothetical protein